MDSRSPEVDPRQVDPELELGIEEYDEDDLEQVGTLQALLQDRRKVLTGLLLVVLLIVAIYILFPKILGLDEAVERLDEGTWYWVVVAIAFNMVAFAAYVALFRGVLGGMRDDDVRRRLDVRASYQITMAGLAATRIFSAAGAGGIALTYWALRRAGMPRRCCGRRDRGPPAGRPDPRGRRAPPGVVVRRLPPGELPLPAGKGPGDPR